VVDDVSIRRVREAPVEQLVGFDGERAAPGRRVEHPRRGPGAAGADVVVVPDGPPGDGFGDLRWRVELPERVPLALRDEVLVDPAEKVLVDVPDVVGLDRVDETVQVAFRLLGLRERPEESRVVFEDRSVVDLLDEAFERLADVRVQGVARGDAGRRFRRVTAQRRDLVGRRLADEFGEQDLVRQEVGVLFGGELELLVPVEMGVIVLVDPLVEGVDELLVVPVRSLGSAFVRRPDGRVERMQQGDDALALGVSLQFAVRRQRRNRIENTGNGVFRRTLGQAKRVGRGVGGSPPFSSKRKNDSLLHVAKNSASRATAWSRARSTTSVRLGKTSSGVTSMTRLPFELPGR
jgi:hypothetical protein